MIRWPWNKRTPKNTVQHKEADEAHKRAVEAKHEAEAKWLDVAHVAAKMDFLLSRNGFGEDVKTAMGRKRA